MEIFSQYDLIVDGTDNFATRYMVNDACVCSASRTCGARSTGSAGQRVLDRVRPVLPLPVPVPPPPGIVPSCAEGGVLGVLCASIGSIQVNEAIKLLTGIGEPLARLMIYDALEMTYRTVKVRKDPECAVCGKNPTITELIDYSTRSAARCPRRPPRPPWVRRSAPRTWPPCWTRATTFSSSTCASRTSTRSSPSPAPRFIPKGEFVSGAALERLPQDKRIVLHSKSGTRSAEALAIVKNAGFADAGHVGGGGVALGRQD